MKKLKPTWKSKPGPFPNGQPISDEGECNFCHRALGETTPRDHLKQCMPHILFQRKIWKKAKYEWNNLAYLWHPDNFDNHLACANADRILQGEKTA